MSRRDGSLLDARERFSVHVLINTAFVLVHGTMCPLISSISTT